jgi:DNA repair exonuclease SbcCD ATPase subunit
MPLLEALSNKLPDLEQALGNSATLRKELDKVPAQLEELSSIYRDAEELVGKLPAIKQARDNGPDLEDLTKYLPTLKSLANDAPKFDEMSKDISKLQQWQTEMESSGSSRERVDAPLPMEEAEVRKIVMPLFHTMDKNLTVNFQKRLHGVAENLGGFLTEERKGREDMDKKLLEVDSKVKELDVRATMMDNKLDDKLGSTSVSILSMERAVDGIKKDMDKFEKQVTHLDANHNHTKTEYFSALHTLQFQILHLDNWASNFTTKQMYSEIVDHITATMPGSVSERVRVLSDRVDSLEDRVDEGSVKRRKMLNGSVMTVNDNH